MATVKWRVSYDKDLYFKKDWTVDCTTIGDTYYKSATTAITHKTLGSGTTWGTVSNCTWEPPRDITKILAGKQSIDLPDGAKLIVDDAGNYRIEDKDAKVTYRANRIREFSPHLNASDLLGQFVEYIGTLGVRKSEVLGLPIELFISWLMIEAAERDSDTVDASVVHPASHDAVRFAIKPRCMTCGRFISHQHRAARFPFCNVEHAKRHVARLNHKTGTKLCLNFSQKGTKND